ncbi:hypothetical protein TrVE_jg4366 [Triparma verrucosa]|uniref:Uncharacterized protein n=1 Tax=Triparma verrucosa TaxID=1606542 RepID=A0A9W7FPS5_9STRA|nr:hypothetical protein TrVE_jg4366 [Triparma verrucosa]
MREENRLAFCALLYVTLDMEVEAATQAEDLASMQYICDEQQCFSFGGDCCADMNVNEPAACADGFELVWDGNKCWEETTNGQGNSFVCVKIFEGVPKAFGGCGPAYGNKQVELNSSVPAYYFVEGLHESVFSCDEKCGEIGGVPACPTSKAQLNTIQMSVLWNNIVTRTKVGSWLGIYADLDTPRNELKLGDAGAFTHCSKVDDVNQGIPYTRGEWGKYGDVQEPSNAGECRVDEYCVGINDDGKLFDIACDTDPDGHLNGGFTYNCLCETGIQKERYEEDAGELSFLSPGDHSYAECYWEKVVALIITGVMIIIFIFCCCFCCFATKREGGLCGKRRKPPWQGTSRVQMVETRFQRESQEGSGIVVGAPQLAIAMQQNNAPPAQVPTASATPYLGEEQKGEGKEENTMPLMAEAQPISASVVSLRPCARCGQYPDGDLNARFCKFCGALISNVITS